MKRKKKPGASKTTKHAPAAADPREAATTPAPPDVGDDAERGPDTLVYGADDTQEMPAASGMAGGPPSSPGESSPGEAAEMPATIDAPSAPPDEDAAFGEPSARRVVPDAGPDADANPSDADMDEGEDGDVEPARELSASHLRGLLEALVFASDKALKARELARLASAPVKQVRAVLAELKEAYAGRGIVLDEVAGGWIFRTGVAYAPFVRDLVNERPVRLSRAQIETLAIAAYRQPLTRPEIDDIRGVDSGATLKLLLERDLVRILGKKDEPGRPLLYGTTGAFLELFGLRSLKDLPTLKEFTELSDDSRRIAEAELGEDPVGTRHDASARPAGGTAPGGDGPPEAPANDDQERQPPEGAPAEGVPLEDEGETAQHDGALFEDDGDEGAVLEDPPDDEGAVLEDPPDDDDAGGFDADADDRRDTVLRPEPPSDPDDDAS